MGLIDLSKEEQSHEELADTVMQLRGWYEPGTPEYQSARSGLMAQPRQDLIGELRYLREQVAPSVR